MIRLSCVTQKKKNARTHEQKRRGWGGGEAKVTHIPHYPSSGMREPSQAIKEVFTTVRKTIDDPYRTLYLSLYRVSSCFRCGIQRSKTCQSLPLLKRTRFERYNKIQLLQRLMSGLYVSFIRPFLTFIIVATE